MSHVSYGTGRAVQPSAGAGSSWSPACLFFLLLLGVSGCATLCSRTRYSVQVSSQPPGAQVRITTPDGQTVGAGVTPFAASLKASRGYLRPAFYQFEYSHTNSHPALRSVLAEADLWILGDAVLPLGVIWLFGVDAVTGAMWRLPESVFIRLEPVNPQPSASQSRQHQTP
jgi:hypothetical protein